jgi:hypothetical protein
MLASVNELAKFDEITFLNTKQKSQKEYANSLKAILSSLNPIFDVFTIPMNLVSTKRS